MEIKFIHFYPDLMNLYGSYANVAVLQSYFEEMGDTVHVELVAPGDSANVAGADFLFMGAGTERSQKAALADFTRFSDAVRAKAEQGLVMLFAGTAMEILGASITDDAGQRYDGIGLAKFTAVQGRRRIVGDVYGKTELYPEPVVGFMNKCSIISGVETPLLTSLSLGFGNESEGGAEGFHWKNVFASQLTGPLLPKNPRMLEAVAAAIYRCRGRELPAERPVWHQMEQGYSITAEQLRRRCERD